MTDEDDFGFTDGGGRLVENHFVENVSFLFGFLTHFLDERVAAHLN